jgi:hypothetical protein
MTPSDLELHTSNGAACDATAAHTDSERGHIEPRSEAFEPGQTGEPASPGDGPACPTPPRDFPEPRAVTHHGVYDWFEDRPAVETYVQFGRSLARAGDLYRNSNYGGGLLLAAALPHVPPTPISTAAALDPLVADRLRVRVLKEGKVKGTSVPTRHLKTMLGSEAFLQQFRPVDAVERNSRYDLHFALTRPGYNDDGYLSRVLHIGDEPWIEPDPDAIVRFLDVMQFASEADRTNAIGAGLTVLLRNHWPGGKPVLVVTSTKSHGGKETIVQFAAGTTRHASISHELADWALQKAFVAALKHEPDLGLLNVENVRSDRNAKEISSSFLERFLTDPEPLLFSPGTGPAVRRRNDVVVAVTTNEGRLSEDLMNRALPIHLEPVGDVANRVTAIGNPKLEFLPANRARIEAELRGMVERWKAEGRPLDARVRHPFGPWAATVGGILMVSGFEGFLANYRHRKTADDPVRRALGLLGAARRDQWLRPGEWARLAAMLGLVKSIVAEGDRDTDLGRERGIGRVMTAHRDESFAVETDDEILTLRLERARRRFETGEEPETRYRFVTLRHEDIPADPEPDETA